MPFRAKTLADAGGGTPSSDIVTTYAFFLILQLPLGRDFIKSVKQWFYFSTPKTFPLINPHRQIQKSTNIGSNLEIHPSPKQHLDVPLVQAICAKAGEEPCCDWVGEDGSGHFVKVGGGRLHSAHHLLGRWSTTVSSTGTCSSYVRLTTS